MQCMPVMVARSHCMFDIVYCIIMCLYRFDTELLCHIACRISGCIIVVVLCRFFCEVGSVFVYRLVKVDYSCAVLVSSYRPRLRSGCVVFC